MFSHDYHSLETYKNNTIPHISTDYSSSNLTTSTHLKDTVPDPLTVTKTMRIVLASPKPRLQSKITRVREFSHVPLVYSLLYVTYIASFLGRLRHYHHSPSNLYNVERIATARLVYLNGLRFSSCMCTRVNSSRICEKLRYIREALVIISKRYYHSKETCVLQFAFSCGARALISYELFGFSVDQVYVNCAENVKVGRGKL